METHTVAEGAGATRGALALVGGDEFRANCERMDRALLAMSARQPARVVILPTAAARQGARQAAQNGVRHFESLGAQARPALILTLEDANDPQHVAELHDADILYLAGGDPAYLLSCVRGSACERVMRAHVAAGGMLAGSSAGAMVMGAAMRYGGSHWTPTLGFAPRVATLPHHNSPPRADAAALVTSLASVSPRVETPVTPLGIATATACVSEDGGVRWRVVGVGAVTVYAATGARVYADGDEFEV